MMFDDEINETDLVAMANEALSIETKKFSLKIVEKILNLAKEVKEYAL